MHGCASLIWSADVGTNRAVHADQFDLVWQTFDLIDTEDGIQTNFPDGGKHSKNCRQNVQIGLPAGVFLEVPFFAGSVDTSFPGLCSPTWGLWQSMTFCTWWCRSNTALWSLSTISWRPTSRIRAPNRSPSTCGSFWTLCNHCFQLLRT